jgi:hydroxymethylglutaryl-CoA lyase
MSKWIDIVEVGPRDGLQNEPEWVPTDNKLTFIADLRAAGLRNIEVTSLVHPKAIPQLADAVDVLARLPMPKESERFSVLVPNAKGLERALEANATRMQEGLLIHEVALLTAVSETFNQKNIRQSVEESLQQMEILSKQAKDNGLSVRGYISTAFHCPYEGVIPAGKTIAIIQHMQSMGLREISIGDTIGKATPDEVKDFLTKLLTQTSPDHLALHFHDTNQLALENVGVALSMGFTIFDSSAGGMGGCPYAPGASGNLSTDDLVRYLHANEYTTGVDSAKLAEASNKLRESINQNPSQ